MDSPPGKCISGGLFLAANHCSPAGAQSESLAKREEGAVSAA